MFVITGVHQDGLLAAAAGFPTGGSRTRMSPTIIGEITGQINVPVRIAGPPQQMPYSKAPIINVHLSRKSGIKNPEYQALVSPFHLVIPYRFLVKRYTTDMDAKSKGSARTAAICRVFVSISSWSDTPFDGPRLFYREDASRCNGGPGRIILSAQ